MTLWELAPGKTATIQGYSPSLEESVLLRLQDLGFSPGLAVECVRHVPFSGPRVYVVSGSVFALEKPVAQLVQMAAINDGTTRR